MCRHRSSPPHAIAVAVEVIRKTTLLNRQQQTMDCCCYQAYFLFFGFSEDPDHCIHTAVRLAATYVLGSHLEGLLVRQARIRLLHLWQLGLHEEIVGGGGTLLLGLYMRLMVGLTAARTFVLLGAGRLLILGHDEQLEVVVAREGRASAVV